MRLTSNFPEFVVEMASGGAEQKIEFDLLLEEKEISSKRQIVETALSYITSLLPRRIKACAEQGFLVKVFFVQNWPIILRSYASSV